MASVSLVSLGCALATRVNLWPLITKGNSDKISAALNDLQTQIMSTDPTNFNKYYNTKRTRDAIRGPNAPKDARLDALKKTMMKRRKELSALAEEDKFTDTIIDALTVDTHKKMLDWYMKRGTYLGALMATQKKGWVRGAFPRVETEEDRSKVIL